MENLAAERGFESVQEFKAAQREDISTKSEYDAYLQKKDKAESEAAAQGGFVNVDEYKKAQYVNMPTKALYDKYLEQQAELILAEEKRKAEEAEAARLAEAAEMRKAEEAEAARLVEAAEEKRTTEEAETVVKYSENFKFISGTVNDVIFCGTQKEGFEVFLADDYKFDFSTITGRADFFKFGMDNKRLDALIVPIRNGKPSYDAITYHNLDKEPEFYYMDGYPLYGYLNWHDYGGGGAEGTHAAPDFKLYRDGSRLAILINNEALNEHFFLPHPDSLVENASSTAKPCNKTTNTSPESLIGERLEGFGKFMQAKYEAMVAEIEAKEAESKF